MFQDSLTIHASVVNMDIKSVIHEFYFEWEMAVPQTNASNKLAKRLSTLGSQVINLTASPPASSLTNSYFGKAYPLYSNKGVSASCVSCRAFGLVTMTGAVGWSIFNPLTLFAGSLAVSGNLSMAIGKTGYTLVHESSKNPPINMCDRPRH